MNGPRLSTRIASRIIRALAPLVPSPMRARWREEWLAEIDAADGDRVIRRASGAWRDVMACRSVERDSAESAMFTARGLGWDIRYSSRVIASSPGFALAAVASLSIGIAATTTAFSAVNALLFRSLPGVRDSTQLVQVFSSMPTGTEPGSPEASYADVRQRLTSLGGIAAHATVRAAIATATESAVGSVVLVSPEYFDLLGTTPAAGRLFGKDVDAAGSAAVSYEFAIRHFNAATAAIGQRVTVNGVAMDIAGVTPPQFMGVEVTGVGRNATMRPEVWVALSARKAIAPPVTNLMNRADAGGNGSWVRIVGRLAPGVTLSQANAQAAAAPPYVAYGRPHAHARLGPLGRGPNDGAADIALIVTIALGIPFVVLAIGCANTANLQLARAARRATEIAVRRSLGAPRGAVVRQLLVESVIVAAIAGVAGVFLTVMAGRLLTVYMPVPSPVDWRVLLFAVGLVLATGIGFGMVPALTATTGNLSAPLKDSAATALYARSRLRGALVVAQVALSILLLVMAGLFTRSLQHLENSGADRDVSHLAAASIDLGLLKYSDARGRAFQQELLARVERIPGVSAVAIAPFAPFSSGPGLTYRTPDHQGPPAYLYTNGGAPLGRFVEAGGLRIVRGRGFTDEDRAGQPKVAVVSEMLARRISPSGNVIDQRLLVGDGGKPSVEVTIVGITAETQLRVVQREAHAMFLPSPLNYDPNVTVWARTTGDPAAILPAIRAIVRELDPALPIRRLDVAEAWRESEIAPMRWIAQGLSLMGLIAVFLAGAGLYAVMSYLVANRRHELAVRVALGARPRDLSRLVVGQALRMTAPGFVIGGLLALAGARFARAMLFGVSPFDPIALGSVALLLVVIAVFSTFPPAFRAAKLDPLVMLRRQ